MKKYRVNVNGTNYEIELELVDENEIKSSVTSAPAAAPVAPAASTPAPAPAAPAPAGGEKIESPMPGTILSVNVAAGDSITKGQVLMILEAMKMENEIMSPIDGKVISVNTSKGATVEAGTLLCVVG